MCVVNKPLCWWLAVAVFWCSVLVSCSSSLSSCGIDRPYVVAHRGGASLGPENTLLCIERAISAGADAVEVDVRLTADGRVVLMHDARVDRTTNGCGRVSSLTLDEVKALCIVDAMGCVTDERVPLLSVVLDSVAGRCNILVEVKVDDERGIEAAVAGLVEERGAHGWVAVQSFSDRVLERFRDLGVIFPLEKLLVFKFPFLPYIFDGSIRRFSLKKYSHVSSFNLHKCFARCGFVGYLHRGGKGVKLWTVKPESIISCSCTDGVITDFPQLWGVSKRE